MEQTQGLIVMALRFRRQAADDAGAATLLTLYDCGTIGACDALFAAFISAARFSSFPPG